MNHRPTLAIGIPAFLMLLGGCIIVQGPAGGGGAGGDRTSDNATSTGSAGGNAGGAAGAAGMGGMGGAGGGVAGQGGAGGGGGPSCVKPEDGTLGSPACDSLNTQLTGKVCGPMMNEDPPANPTCVRLYSIVQNGAFDVLVGCLKTIPGDATNACNATLVGDCVKEMYARACPSVDAASTCDNIANFGCKAGTVFNSQQCVQDLTPFNAAGLTEIVTCMNNSATTEPDCNKAYEVCYTDVFAY